MFDSDEDLRAALAQHCRFAIVRVEEATVEKTGTRSQTAVYRTVVERAVEGEMPSSVTFKHFGQPQMETARVYAVGALEAGRFAPAWQLCFAAAIDADPERAAEDLRRRLSGATNE